jgi:hypothetical protein
MAAPDKEDPPGETAGFKDAQGRNGARVNYGSPEQPATAVVSELPTQKQTPSVLLPKWKLIGKAIFDPHLARCDLKVLYFIVESINSKSGRWFLSTSDIAKAVGVDPRTVTRAITSLCGGGYLLRKSGNRTFANEYRMGAGESVPTGESAGTDEIAGTGEFAVRYGRIHPKATGENARPYPLTYPLTESTEEKHMHESSDSRCRTETIPPTKPTPDALQLPDWLPAQAWIDWHDYRLKRTPRGWSDKAQELSVSTLAKLRSEGHDPVKVIEASIENGWSGLFPLKTQNNSRGSNNANQRQRGESVADYVARVNRVHDEREAVFGIL